MTSTTSRSGEAVPAPPVFSYAQAAKGRTTPATTSSAPSNQATSGVSTPAKGTISTINTPSGGSERGDQSVNGSIDGPSRVEHSGDGLTSESKVSTSITSVSRSASPSLGTASTSTLTKEEDDFILVGAPTESTRDRSSQEKGSTEKPSEATEGRKGKKGKKQKNAEKEAAEKEKEEVKPEVLVPAPLPTVNFWSARKAEAAKTKPAPVQTSSEPTISNETSKSPDNKRRGKATGADETEKSLGSAQNGVAKDASTPTKSQKKTEAAGKPKEDQSAKRSGPRGSRAPEEKPSATLLPPPVEDAMSWPTPETALEEEKRKVQEKVDKDEKDDNSSNKPRAKEKWVPVPYVPSVAFNTPLPTRGGRGRGGARGGGRTEAGGRSNHAASNGAGDKAQNNSAAGTPSAESEKRMSRGEAPRAASLPPNSNKRQSSDQTGTRDQRKPSVTTGAEKTKSGANKGESGVNGDFTANPAGDAMADQSRGEHSRNFKSEQGAFPETPSRANAAADRRSEPNMKGFEQSKDGFSKDNNRDRAEGRADRGRGGFRGSRNNNHFQNGQQHPQHIFTNGHGPQPPNGYPVRSAGPYSPPLPPPAFSNQYPVPSSRGGRGGHRSQSIPNNAMYGRFPPNGANSQHMPSLQTSNTMYDYQPMQSMSATPFNPYVDHVSVLAMVTMQLEYYFSIDNLCKDVYLRSHMDSQGFVFLSFIGNFKRIQALTQDFEMVRYACQESETIDYVTGDDGIDRVRRAEGWEKWVRPVEDRDESARNDGPAQVHRRYPRMGQMIMPGNHAMSPPPFSPNGSEFRPFGNGAPVAPVMNGNGNHYHPETPLSAAVPDFAPGLMPMNGTQDPLEAEVTITDEEVLGLTMVFNPNGADDSKPKIPFHNASSRTFSNGSIDGRSIAEEIDDSRQGRPLTNGSRAAEASPDAIRRSRSPFTPLSPTKTSSNNGPPVMWVKGHNQQMAVAEHLCPELYTSYHDRALKHREMSAPGETHHDMKTLYEFWTHFLCRNFNLTMYNEFRSLAYEDSRSHAMTGMKNLITYYDETLNSKKKVIPEALACHYVELVKSEESPERPAFQKLRAAWRNGALDMKSRKKIDNFVDQKLREELERSPKQKSDSS
ncbi:putative HTH La-type RNA-binding protein [Lachnellula suecica]|uniref:Putative HTH La-type RNA-binding protein n=1 Tax=Lachnellula suecica TaxID=602035 RepID=A0A8T9C7B5_9HELO|nr:putative HTH La-type RNA-binding protein [Lachnellula suecica]